MLTTLAAADLPRPPPTARPAALLPGWMGGGDAIGPAECMRGRVCAGAGPSEGGGTVPLGWKFHPRGLPL